MEESSERTNQYIKLVEYLYNGKKQNLNDQEQYKCRFCGRTKTRNEFRDIAHAVSESIGNKSIITHYECDECNKHFSENEENELGKLFKFIKANRSLKGKKGKINHNKNVDINYDDTTKQMDVKIKEFYDKNFFIKLYKDCNDNGKMILVNNIQINGRLIYKAFLKFALSVIPEDKTPDFEKCFEFLKNDDGQKKLIVNFILYKELQRDYKITIYENTILESGTPKYIGLIDLYQLSCVIFLDFNDKYNYLPHIMMPECLGLDKSKIYSTYYADYSSTEKIIQQKEEIDGQIKNLNF